MLGLKPLKNIQFCLSSRKKKILTADIQIVFRGLKSDFDAEFGQKGAFLRGFTLLIFRVQTRSFPDFYSPDAAIEMKA